MREFSGEKIIECFYIFFLFFAFSYCKIVFVTIIVHQIDTRASKQFISLFVFQLLVSCLSSRATKPQHRHYRVFRANTVELVARTLMARLPRLFRTCS